MRITLVGNVLCDHSSETHHAKSLESLGHEVVKLQEGTTPGEFIRDESLRSDLMVYVHTHSWRTPGMPIEQVLTEVNRAGIPTVSYHLDRWLGLPRQHDLEQDPFYRSIGWFFTVDAMQAEWFNQKTAVKGRYLPAGVYGAECYMAEPTDDRFDVAFVGSMGYHEQYPMRPRLINWLRETYGDRFRHYGGDGRGTVRGSDLNQVYANAKIAIGDSLCLDPNYAGKYWSDRIYESCGRGAMVAHPRFFGLEDEFTDGEHVVMYEHGNFDELKQIIDFYIDDENSWEREKIRRAGHERVKQNFTYRHRWQTILDTVFAK